MVKSKDANLTARQKYCDWSPDRKKFEFCLPGANG